MDYDALESRAAIWRGEAVQAAAKRHYLLSMAEAAEEAIDGAQEELDEAVRAMAAHGESADVDFWSELGIQEGVAERRAAHEAQARATIIAFGGQPTPVGGGR